MEASDEGVPEVVTEASDETLGAGRGMPTREYSDSVLRIFMGDLVSFAIARADWEAAFFGDWASSFIRGVGLDALLMTMLEGRVRPALGDLTSGSAA